MRIYTIHGIVDDYTLQKQIYRSYVSKASFETFLNSQIKPLGKWRGHDTTTAILTVDDSTLAGAHACISARKLGHEVIFFINPHQIITGNIYWFSLLNCLIDYRTVDAVVYNNQRFVLKEYTSICAFRKAVKKDIMAKGPDQAFTYLNTLKDLLHPRPFSIPEHLQTINIEDLKLLIQEGVQIESHGWSHIDIAGMNCDHFMSDLNKTSQWLNDTLNITTSLYAVPFGESDPALLFPHIETTNYFLADNNRAQGQLSEKCWNRIDITKQLQNSIHDYTALSYR